MCPNGENQEYFENSHKPPNEGTCLRENSNSSLISPHNDCKPVCILSRIS